MMTGEHIGCHSLEGQCALGVLRRENSLSLRFILKDEWGKPGRANSLDKSMDARVSTDPWRNAKQVDLLEHWGM